MHTCISKYAVGAMAFPYTGVFHGSPMFTTRPEIVGTFGVEGIAAPLQHAHGGLRCEPVSGRGDAERADDFGAGGEHGTSVKHTSVRKSHSTHRIFADTCMHGLLYPAV